jgi:cytochrome c nitrite reductase small subunit
MRRWLLPLSAVLIGMAVGMGSFTFVYARGWSYVTNDPAACANCHIMEPQYAAWMKSSHRSVAVCNDCHTPHDLVGKYATKARNGFWHSFYFTTGRFPEPIHATPRSREIAEAACRSCHTAITDALVHGSEVPPEFGEDGAKGKDDLVCTRCHADVGHQTR